MNTEIEDERNKWITACRKAEKSHYDLVTEFEKLQKDMEVLQKQSKSDREASKTLAEVLTRFHILDVTMNQIVETQKEALEQASKIDEENKKVIAKLKH